MRTRVRFRVWDLNWHWNADGFDARSRRPAQLENPLAGLQSGRLFDGVRTGSRQPAALRLRTFNSRLVRGAAPPPIAQNPTLIGWVFFCPECQCWRGFRPCCDGRRRPGWPGFGRFSVLCPRPFSVSAKEDFAPTPALARVSGDLFVRQTACTLATRPRTGYPFTIGRTSQVIAMSGR